MKVIPKNISEKGLPRSFEFLMALSGLILLSPLLLICAVLIKLTSSGSVLFCQPRFGRNGELFKLYKFRTMYDAKKGLPFTSRADSRITPVGKFLRHWKIDEFPELYNILIGEMSFVGPRPEVPELVDLTNPQWQEVFKARPGLTDPVTISLRNEESLLASADDKERFYRDVLQPYKLEGYVKYLKTKSFANDLKIIFQTVKCIALSHHSGGLPIESLERKIS